MKTDQRQQTAIAPPVGSSDLVRRVCPGCVVRLYDDLAGYGMRRIGRDSRNWSDELVLAVEPHILHTRQIAACNDGKLVSGEHLFPVENSICFMAEHYDLLEQLEMPMPNDKLRHGGE